jgi:uncharacterized membrane protein YkvA (DUF1232 family)
MAETTKRLKPPALPGGGQRQRSGKRVRRGPRRRVLIWRTIALLALLPLAGRLPVHARIMAGLIRDPRVPASRKALLAAALGYAAWPRDIIPNRFPVVGVMDDVVVAALAFDAFLRRIVYRLPAVLDLGARVVRDSGLGPRVRGLLDKEGSPA